VPIASVNRKIPNREFQPNSRFFQRSLSEKDFSYKIEMPAVYLYHSNHTLTDLKSPAVFTLTKGYNRLPDVRRGFFSCHPSGFGVNQEKNLPHMKSVKVEL